MSKALLKSLYKKYFSHVLVFVISLILSIALLEFIKSVSNVDPKTFTLASKSKSIVFISMVFALSYYFFQYVDNKFEGFYPWFLSPNRRLFYQGIVFFSFSALFLYGVFVINHFLNDRPGPFVIRDYEVSSFFVSYFFFLVILLYIIAVKSITKLNTYYTEMEDLKQKKANAEYKALQDQLNPHFLFNSLNVLISEIEYDPENAQKFTHKLSDVYRYVLQSQHLEYSTIKAELDFVKAYVFLHQVRLGDVINLEISVPEDLKEARVLPLTLQLLCENAIKHNVINKKHPLEIKVFIEGGYLYLRNNKNARTHEVSMKVGLNNLQKRLELLKAPSLEVEETDLAYQVGVPIFKA
ncbi:sensor histidine kinase [Aureibacter tunicatorum]|uniref:Signal transduction histidine kinase internal region domain-containing protein n=1 Tax=Aureibacter tunicatorum TaxID=866807 RepID=A0AAE3XNM4_9BACT|nr:histidine kinase [Aureibacter tunicatorum]MDR6240272.1 hypothetical protein [Aureibacter tunicatorum]BDD05847.1 histidine kinase [Aureibacter tunicatorum]